MAALVCWASGLMQVVPDKDVDPTPSGPVVLQRGTSGRLNSVMSAHGVFNTEYRGFYVPGCVPVPNDPDAAAKVMQDNMTAVIAFNKKLQRARAKQKGLKHLKELDDAT